MKNFLRESVDWKRINCPLPSSSSGFFPHNIFKRKNPGEDVIRLDLKGLTSPRKSVYNAFLKGNYGKGDYTSLPSCNLFSKPRMYADDTTLTTSAENPCVLEHKMNYDMNLR